MTPRSATTLVVIDDDPDVLRATARILVQAGYEVMTGVNATQALELTRRHLPAILLLDVMLPDGNGVDIARTLKGEPALASVCIILLSGVKTTGQDQAAGLDAGLADGYIARPFSKPEFLARIDAMLRLRSVQEALREALARVKRLEGLLSICMLCKKVRAENNDWHQLERYIGDHSDVVFSHGVCPECLVEEMKKLD